jgi:hypothetical protein
MIINNLISMDSHNVESVKIHRRQMGSGTHVTEFVFYFTNQTSVEFTCFNGEKEIDVRLGDPND